MPSSMRPKASRPAVRCGTGRWRCDWRVEVAIGCGPRTSIAPRRKGRRAALHPGNAGFVVSRTRCGAKCRSADPGPSKQDTPSCVSPTAPLISSVRCSAAPRIWRVQFRGLSCKDVCRTLRSPKLCPEITRFTMVNRMQFYIDGAWVDPVVKKSTPVVNPATEEAMYEIALGSKADVDKAVAAAKRAFDTFSQTSREERVALLSKVIEVYKSRMKEIGAAVSDEMGAPLPMAEKLQAGAGLGHIAATLDVLKNYHFEEPAGSAVVVREPVGVIGMITPWNWPLNQIACKVAPALAAGCTMILKPSEFTPSSALIFAEILHEAGVPKGVFNLINGLGPEVGAAMSEHPDIDMISFTGSTRAGIDVAKRAAPTVKRVSQELGG